MHGVSVKPNSRYFSNAQKSHSDKLHSNLSFYRSDRLRYYNVEISSSTLLMVEPRGKSALQRLVDVGGSELFFEEFADFSSRWPTFRKVLAAVDLTEWYHLLNSYWKIVSGFIFGLFIESVVLLVELIPRFKCKMNFSVVFEKLQRSTVPAVTMLVG